jgi:lysophospholipase-2
MSPDERTNNPLQTLPQMLYYKALSCIALLIMNINKIASMSTSATSKKAALVFLHGLGDSPAGWSHLKDSLPRLQPSLKNIEYVFPPAPIIPLSINGGSRMPGWFDLFDWPIGIGVQEDREGKLKAVAQIEDIVKKLEEQGIPRSRVVVGGFSQGGAIALLAAYHSSPQRPPYAACVSLSGWLTLTDELNIEHTSTPLFWAHGQYDDKVLFEQQAFGIKKLQLAGVSVQDESYPMGHESHPQEMADLAKFLDKALFRGEEQKSEL